MATIFVKAYGRRFSAARRSLEGSANRIGSNPLFSHPGGVCQKEKRTLLICPALLNISYATAVLGGLTKSPLRRQIPGFYILEIRYERPVFF